MLVSEPNQSHSCAGRGIPSIRAFGRVIPMWAVCLLFLALALAAYSPYIHMGFAGDDFIFVSMMEGAAPTDPAWGLWYGDIGSYPTFSALWWVEPGVQAAFLRPVPSWTLMALHEAFGRSAAYYHVFSILIHGLSAFIAFLLLRRLSRRNGVALIAALLFLICEDHGMTVGWIATITDLMCVLFLSLALLCHVSSRESGKRRQFGLSLVFALLAMASKESAVVYPVLVAAFELIYAGGVGKGALRPSMRERLRLFFGRWWAWGVPSAVFLAYLTFYRLMVPPMRNLMYEDPLGDPVGYLGMMLKNLPVMFSGLLTQLLPSVVTFVPGTMPFVVGGGVVLTLALLWALLPYRRERAVWFSLVAFVVGLLPGLATDPGERLLYLPSAYGMFFVAWLLVQLPALKRRLAPDAPPGVRVLGRFWSWYLVVAVVIAPVVLLFVYPSMWKEGLELPERTVLETMPEIDDDSCEHIVYLNTNSSFNSFYLKDIYRFHNSHYIDVHLLSSFSGKVWAKRESEDTLLLRTDDVGWLSNMFARVLRVTPELEVGYVREGELFTATVLDTTPDRKDVQEVRFEFKVPLDDPSLSLICYDGKDYREWKPSSEWKLLNSSLERYGL